MFLVPLVFQYCLCSGKWSHWNEHLSDYVVPDINPISYGSLLIPNVSSIRTDFLIRNVTGIQRFKT